MKPLLMRMRRRREIAQCQCLLGSLSIVIVLLILVAVTAVDGFSVGTGRWSVGSRPQQQQQQQQPVLRMASVRLAAEAKNASEISHENVAAYREKLSIIPRANGDDSSGDADRRVSD